MPFCSPLKSSIPIHFTVCFLCSSVAINSLHIANWLCNNSWLTREWTWSPTPIIHTAFILPPVERPGMLTMKPFPDHAFGCTCSLAEPTLQMLGCLPHCFANWLQRVFELNEMIPSGSPPTQLWFSARCHVGWRAAWGPAECVHKVLTLTQTG